MRKLNYFFAIALTLGVGVCTASAQTRIPDPNGVGHIHTPAETFTPPAKRTCSTMEKVEQSLAAHPELRQSYEEAQRLAATTPANKVTGIITIPVVVHVLYRTAAGNISDARINEQIAVLNADYRKLNTDASSVPAVWTSTAADVGVEFCLASQDPSGNPTTGIERISTTTSNIGSTSDYYVEAPIWNRNSYLNLWVCEIGGGVLGFAYLPGTAGAAYDGVVIDYHYFGKTGATSPFNKGRTATHEVGHWLNLKHIWGDDGSACSGSDGCADTPNQADENYGCPTFPHTDACSPSSPGVMFMNYMDYTNDNCMYMFTNDQSTRINNTLSGSRGTLIFSTGCSGGGPGPTVCADTIFEPDLGTATVYTSSGGWGYVGGHNNYEDVSKANYVKATDYGSADSLFGAHLVFAAGYSTGPSAAVTVKVWDNDGPSGAPGTVLSTQNLLVDDIISASGDVYIDLPTPLVMSGDYYMGIGLSYSPTIDTTALITDLDGETTPGIAWEEFAAGGGWYPMSDATNSWGINVKLGVYPIMGNCSVGVQEIGNTDRNVHLFPNPNTGNFNLQFYLDTRENVTISVLNMVGQQVYTENLGGFTGNYSKELDLRHVSKGVYHVVVRSGSHQEVTKVVIH